MIYLAFYIIIAFSDAIIHYCHILHGWVMLPLVLILFVVLLSTQDADRWKSIFSWSVTSAKVHTTMIGPVSKAPKLRNTPGHPEL